MRILICKPNLSLAEELSEYFHGCDWETDIAGEPGAIYQALSRQKYDVALYYVSSLDDFAVVRYINTTFPDIRVVITSDTGFDACIDNIRQGAFTTIKPPYHLTQLQEMFTKELPKLVPAQA
jgi:DNA-binding NtrC family response regulator